MRTRLVLAALLLTLTGCSAGGAQSDKAAAPARAEAPRSVVAKAASLPALARSVIRTADLDVRVRDAAKAADRAAAIASAHTGRVDDDQRSQADKGSATMVLRVPPAQLLPTLTALAALGTETDRKVVDQDVTDQAVDLVSRLATQRASVARVRVLLDRAQSISDITQIEAELTRREADLESLQARSQALGAQVDLATITLHLQGEGVVLAGHQDRAGFLDGLSGGWHALLALGRAAAVTLGALLPFAWLLVVPLLAVRVRRRRRTSPTI